MKFIIFGFRIEGEDFNIQTHFKPFNFPDLIVNFLP